MPSSFDRRSLGHVVHALFALAIAQGALGCSSSVSSCTPGESRACACVDGRTGAQVCEAGGSFASCVCAGSSDRPDSTIALADAGSGVLPGVDAGPVEPPPTGARRVFLTHTSFVASAVLDACQNSADAAALGGRWVPWLTTSDLDALDRVQGTGPWHRLDGELAFRNRAQLAITPLVPISIDERLGDSFGADVWTGTTTGGRPGRLCSEWGGSSFYGTHGYSNGIDSWTESSEGDCGSRRHVYCFEQ
jgi:hypothetical protein